MSSGFTDRLAWDCLSFTDDDGLDVEEDFHGKYYSIGFSRSLLMHEAVLSRLRLQLWTLPHLIAYSLH